MHLLSVSVTFLKRALTLCVLDRYSTRELVSIVKHLEQYPADGLSNALRNVFDFDFQRREDLSAVSDILSRYGVALDRDLTAYTKSLGRPTQVRVSLGRVAKLASTQPTTQVWPRVGISTVKAITTPIPWLRNKRTKECIFPIAGQIKPAPLAAKGLANGLIPQTNLRSSTFSEKASAFQLPTSGLVLCASTVPVNLAPKTDHDPTGSEKGTTILFAVRESQPQFFFVNVPGESSTFHGDISAVSLPMSSVLPWSGSYRAPPMDMQCVHVAGTVAGFGHVTKICALNQRAHTVHIITCHLADLSHPANFMSMIQLQNIEVDSSSGAAVRSIIGEAFMQSEQCRSSIVVRGPATDGTFIVWSNTANVLVEVSLFETISTHRADSGAPTGLCRVHTIPSVPNSVQPLNDGSLLVAGESGKVFLVQFDTGMSPGVAVHEMNAAPQQPVFLCPYPRPMDAFSNVVYFDPINTMQRPLQVVAPHSSSDTHLTTLKWEWDIASAKSAGIATESPPSFISSVALSSQIILNYHRTNEVEFFDVVDLERGFVKRVVATGAQSQAGLSPGQSNLPRGLVGNGYSAQSTSEAPTLHIVPLPLQRLLAVNQRDGKCTVWDFNSALLKDAFQQWRLLTGWDNMEGQSLALQRLSETEYQKQINGQRDGADGEGGGSEDGQGQGDGNGNGSGSGNGEGRGNGSGKGGGSGDGQGSGDGSGEGSGSGTGRGGQPGGSGQATGKTRLEDIVFRDPMSEFEELELEGGMTEATETGAQELDPEQALAKRLAKEAAWEALSKEIDMMPSDVTFYTKYLRHVKSGVASLKRILEALEAKENERVWTRHQTVGELDDNKLINGLAGERAIYRRRKKQENELNLEFTAPKRLHLLFDLSMSMSRFWADGRLQRSLETAVMVMESFDAFEHKIKYVSSAGYFSLSSAGVLSSLETKLYRYKIGGHSGDTDDLTFVDWDTPPRTRKERLQVIRKMNAHAETCDSGDNTLVRARHHFAGAVIALTQSLPLLCSPRVRKL